MSTRVVGDKFVDNIQTVSEGIGVLLVDAVRFGDESYQAYFTNPDSHPVIAKIAQLKKTSPKQVFEDLKETFDNAHRSSYPENGEEGVRSYIDFEDYMYLAIASDIQQLERTDLQPPVIHELEQHKHDLESLREEIERNSEWRNTPTRQNVMQYIERRFTQLRTTTDEQARKHHEETQVLLSLSVADKNFKIPSPKHQ